MGSLGLEVSLTEPLHLQEPLTQPLHLQEPLAGFTYGSHSVPNNSAAVDILPLQAEMQTYASYENVESQLYSAMSGEIADTMMPLTGCQNSDPLLQPLTMMDGRHESSGQPFMMEHEHTNQPLAM